METKRIVAQLVVAQKNEIDPSVVSEIKMWSDPPKALQILKTIDMCDGNSLATPYVVRMMNHLLDVALDREHMTYAEIEAKATWRI